MKIDGVKLPKSSFLGLEKDLAIIIDQISKNRRLQKLLYYTTHDALDRPELNSEQFTEMFNKNIKIIPKLYVDGSVLNYIIVNFDNFTQSNNPQFRDSIVEFDIVCHFDQWHLKDFQLRPYRIAAEIDSMIDNQKLTGIGLLQFLGARQIVLTDEYAGVCLMYEAIHGGEDKKFMPNPNDEEQFQEDFYDWVEKNREE